MTRLKLHGDGGDGDIARALRALYAAPPGDAYWTALEAKVMHRLEALEPAWWGELDRWIRPALLAAAVLLLAAGVVMFRAGQEETRLAYDAILQPSAVPVETAIRPAFQDDRQATVRFLFTH